VATLACATVLAACSGSSFNASATTATTTTVVGTTTTVLTEDQHLVPAEHQQCADLGRLVETYFLSGDTSGHHELDQDYASERAAILGQPSAARAGLARADADNVIQVCDKKLSEQQAANAQATAAAQETARKEAGFRSGCTAHHGRVIQPMVSYRTIGLNCVVDYPTASDQELALNDNGTFDQAQADNHKSDCAGSLHDAQTAATEGHPWSQLPVYHADTGVCEHGSP
jgi:hypothetical protein